VFFAYIGFDTISTLSQETVHPQKNVPIGTLGSLGVCTLLYILTALVLTGVASYTLLNVPDPMSIALNIIGIKLYWLSFVIKLAILAGLASVVLVMVLGLTRIIYSIGIDRLIPKAFAKIHPTTKTPLFTTYMVGIGVAAVAGFFPIDILGQLAAMATLFILSVVCLGVLLLRYRHPELKRPFKTPLVPFTPLLGIAACLFQMICMPLITWFQFLLWHVIGVAIYFFYGMRKSRLQEKAIEHTLGDTLY
jgi:APA family basic amino acid/polyamine antiporter